MKNSFISVSASGCLFSSGGASFLIDPGNGSTSMLRCMYKKPDCILFSGAHRDVASGFPALFFQNSNMLYYSSAMTRKILGRQVQKFGDIFSHGGVLKKNPADEIIDCSFKRGITVNRGCENSAQIYFRPCGTFPGMSAIFIKTRRESMLYVPECSVSEDSLKTPDLLVLKAEAGGLSRKLAGRERLVVDIKSFSGLFYVLQYLHGKGKGIRAGIDNTVIQPACEYLRWGYPVFSKHVRPLSEFERRPQLILTSNPGLYSGAVVTDTDMFINSPELSDIYAFCKKINPAKAIVCSEKIKHTHHRGNIVFSNSYYGFC